MTTEQKNKLIAISGQTEFSFITEGVESSATGYIVSEDALTRLATSLEESDVLATRNGELVQQAQQSADQLATAQAQVQQLQADLSTAQGQNTTLQARVDELEAAGGVTQTQKEADDLNDKNKLGAHEDPNNPLNKIADGLLGKPAIKKAD